MPLLNWFVSLFSILLCWIAFCLCIFSISFALFSLLYCLLLNCLAAELLYLCYAEFWLYLCYAEFWLYLSALLSTAELLYLCYALSLFLLSKYSLRFYMIFICTVLKGLTKEMMKKIVCIFILHLYPFDNLDRFSAFLISFSQIFP